MRNAVFLLVGVIVLFTLPSLILKGTYGESYRVFGSEDAWVPDGTGGWVKHGEPAGPPPDELSETVPLAFQYIPILLPALLLILFLFTPLSRHMDRKPEETDAEANLPGESEQETDKT